MILENSYTSFVNLDHRQDRLKRMKATLKQAGIVAVRTPGMLPEDYKGDRSRVRMMQGRTPGAIGCYFSQLRIMEKAFRQGKHAFVMEDDLIICSDFKQRIAMMEEFIQTHEWDVLWLGGTFHINPPWWHTRGLERDAEVTDVPYMMRTYGAFCTYAYIVNKDSLEKVLCMLDGVLVKTIGIDYSFIQIQPQLQTFAFVPGCITQYDNKSDIGNGWTLFSNFKKLGPYWFQDRLEDFDPAKFNWHEARVKK